MSSTQDAKIISRIRSAPINWHNVVDLYLKLRFTRCSVGTLILTTIFGISEDFLLRCTEIDARFGEDASKEISNALGISTSVAEVNSDSFDVFNLTIARVVLFKVPFLD